MSKVSHEHNLNMVYSYLIYFKSSFALKVYVNFFIKKSLVYMKKICIEVVSTLSGRLKPS